MVVLNTTLPLSIVTSISSSERSENKLSSSIVFLYAVTTAFE